MQRANSVSLVCAVTVAASTLAFPYDRVRHDLSVCWKLFWIGIILGTVSGHSCTKMVQCQSRNLLKRMAGTTRLELATSAVTGQRSNQLNYVPTAKTNDLR